MKAQIEIVTDQPGHFLASFDRVIIAVFERLKDNTLRDGTSLGNLRGSGKKIGFYQIAFEGTGIPEYCSQNGDCETCSLKNYNKDCRNNPLPKIPADGGDEESQEVTQ